MEKKDQPSADSFDFEEDDILDLSEPLQDDEILDLTSPVSPSGKDDADESEEVYDLDSYLAEKGKNQTGVEASDDLDEVIDLVQPFQAVEQDDDIIELVETLPESAVENRLSIDEDEDVIDLIEPVTQAMDDDDTIDLVEPVTQVLDDDEPASGNDLDGDEDFDFDSPATESFDEDDIIELDTPVADAYDETTIDLTQQVDDEEILDLTEEIAAKDSFDDEILELTESLEEDETLDLTEEVGLADDFDDEVIELTQTVENTGDPEAEEDLDDIIDLDEPATATLDEEIIDLDLLEIEEDEDDILELGEPVKQDELFAETTHESMDDLFEETLSDLDEKTLESGSSSDFATFAEQTSEHLQFDVEGSAQDESSKHTIINAEPVKDSFDFDSFAEQTTGHLKFKPDREAMKISAAVPGDEEETDIDSEIMNLSLDALSLDERGLHADGEDLTESTALAVGGKEDLIKELEDGYPGDILDVGEIITDEPDGADRADEPELLDATWESEIEKDLDDTVEMEFDEMDGMGQSPRDDDQAIAEVLGLDVSDVKGKREDRAVAGLPVMGIPQEQVDLAVERVIRKMYGEKLDDIFREVIGRAISEDIERIKDALKRENGSGS